MILLADSGSTKTEWAYVSKTEVLYHHTIGMNPYFTSEKELQKIIDEVYVWLTGKNVEKIIFYGSGCNSTEKGTVLQDIFKNRFQVQNIEVSSDLVGAAKALFGDKSGIAVILGTGANSGFYDGKEIGFKTESLGYILGDEGSGAYIGKEFVKCLLYHDFPSDIENEFVSEYGIGKSEILEAVYSKPFPNRYLASFTHFMKKHEQHVAINAVLKDSFEALVSYHLQNYPQKFEYEFGFVGSIAWHFQDVLKEVCKQHDLKVNAIIKRPLENLVKYYS